MCLKDPGYEVDVQVRSDLRLFIEAWRGIRDLRAEIRARQRPGRELRLAQQTRVTSSVRS
jgi:hypothetical protein